MRLRAGVLLLLAAAVACVRTPPDVVPAPVPSRITSLTLAGETSLLPLERFPPVLGLPFGGISGLASVRGGAALLGVCDDRTGTRVYRFSVEAGSSFRVSPTELIPLQRPPEGPATLDLEGIALLANGHMVVVSEGVGSREPRVPPALVLYGAHGQFLRQLPVRERFVPNPTGPLVRGVRSNLGFESLTVTPDGGRLFTATETALAQDGDVATFDSGARARILEYVRRGEGFEPAREFVYEIHAVVRPSFAPAEQVNGLVELLAMDDNQLLAMERSYVEEAGETGRGVNRIRLYRVSLAGATDVSAHEALTGIGSITPLSKELLLDLSDLGNLPPGLAGGLDNFEGLSFGPRLPDGRETLILVSDDNFNKTQRTWFLLLAVGQSRPAQRLQ